MMAGLLVEPAETAMPTLDTCPRCRAERLAVVYFDANDAPIGGHIQCPDCGPRHSEELSFEDQSVRATLLERKAS
jgi:transcription elongation factor Elf1